MRSLAAGAVAAIVLLAGFGSTAGAKSQSWEVVACSSSSKAKSHKCEINLEAKGFTGYAIETEENGPKFEVAKDVASKSDARAEVRALKDAGFRFSHVEND